MPVYSINVNGQKKKVEVEEGTIAALSIPVQRRDKPLTYTVPIKRQELSVRHPIVSTEAYKPEPALKEAE